jgi:hypothetical protein
VPHANHVVCGRDPSLRARVYTPLDAARALVSVHAPFAVYALTAVHASFYHPCSTWASTPPSAMRAPRACPCHLYVPLLRVPLLRVPLDYKFHKVVVHSTTWAFGPSTTERWLTAKCLGGDHLFYIHSHGHARGCGCMHIRFHVIFLFIVNASQLGGHIKLLASLYIL